MSRQSRCRVRRPIWMVALLALALPILAGACSGSGPSTDSTGADGTAIDTLESGDLTGFDVKVHQAVG